MASESESVEARTANKKQKQPNITFTLPMSCQICLGKVKQPVLCPNYHVFCQLCLDIWLERNNQCPACRAEIGPSNPIKHIIGGQLAEESQRCQSTPDLRRARLDLLYREYEDQMEGLRKENLVLRTENGILNAQLGDAEAEIEKHKSGKPPSEKPAASSSSAAPQDGPSLLQLTKNLKEAQKLYSEIKNEMSKLKQENSKMKDENVNLTRENDNLRLEIAQRSPKKFGRFTVATLETKLSECEKEVRQLKSALERSDAYIEELEQEIKALTKVNKELKDSNGVKPGVFPWAVKSSSSSASSHHDETDGYHVPQTRSSTSRQGSASGKTFNFLNNDQHTPAAGPSKGILSRGGSRQSLFRPEVNSPAEQAKRTLFGKETDPEPVVISEERLRSQERSVKELGSTKAPIGLFGKGPSQEAQRAGVKEKSTKRVHFNVAAEAGEGSSFNLEMPSPFSHPPDDSSNSQQPGSAGPVSPRGREFSFPTMKSPQEDSHPRQGGSSSASDGLRKGVSEFDRHIMELLQKANAGPRKVDQEAGSSSNLSHKSGHNVNDSSHLSVPEGDSSGHTTGKLPSGESDLSLDLNNDGHGRSHPGELDISMTPELNDCLQLMDRAERNMQGASQVSRPGSAVSGSGHPGSVSQAGQPIHLARPASPGAGYWSSHPHPSGHKLPSSSRHIAATISSSSGAGFGSTGTISKWEKDFFTSLQANPYKSGNLNNHAGLLSNSRIKTEPPDDYLEQLPARGNVNSSSSSSLFGRNFLSSERPDFMSSKSASGQDYTNAKNDFRIPSSARSLAPTEDSSPPHYKGFEDPVSVIFGKISSQPHSLHALPSHSRTPSHSAANGLPSSSIHIQNIEKTSDLPSSASDLHSRLPTTSLIIKQDPPPYESHQPSTVLSSRSDDIPSLSQLGQNKSLDSSDLDWPDSVSDIKTEWPDEVDGSPKFRPDRYNESFVVPVISGTTGKKKKAGGGLKKGGGVSKSTKKKSAKALLNDDSLNLSEPGSGRSAGSGSADLSDFLPEPKRRLVDIEDDSDFEISPNKSTKR